MKIPDKVGVLVLRRRVPGLTFRNVIWMVSNPDSPALRLAAICLEKPGWQPERSHRLGPAALGKEYTPWKASIVVLAA